MADEDEGSGSGGLMAPYTAFSSVKTATRNMKEHGIPGRIDRSVLTNFSGSVASQIMQAFKFLGLTSDEGEPTPALNALVAAAEDEDGWSKALAPVLKRAYAPMFTLDLFTASPSQFVQHFRKTYAGADNVSRKSLTFFVNALQDSKIPVSTYVLKNKKPRTSGSGKKRAPKAPRADAQNNGANANNNAGNNVPPAQTSTKVASEMLLSLFDTKMDQKEQDALWLLIKHFKTKGQ